MTRWRRARLPLLLIALLVLVPTAAVLVTATQSPARALDPANPAPSGTRALAHVLAGQGVRVVRVERVAQARQRLQAGAGGRDDRSATLVVTDPGVLARSKLASVSAAAGRVVLLDPSASALRAVTPALRVRSDSRQVPASRRAGCDDPDAVAAGTITGSDEGDAGAADGEVVRRAPDAPTAARTAVCFAGTYATATTSGRTVAALTDASAMTNGHLAQAGNAALALRTLGAAPRVVWLVASPLDAPATGGRSLSDLAPRWVAPLVVQLLLVAVAAVLWRSRRLGALVTEPLPVVVRAAETVEGRAALYRAAGSPAASAAALRAASRWRLAARLGLPAGAGGEQVADAAAAVIGARGQAGGGPAPGDGGAIDVRAALLGPPPAGERALVALAHDLDALEDAVAPHRTTTPGSST